ncbi:MAG: hypothetical protein ABI629_08595 [bacterium]
MATAVTAGTAAALSTADAAPAGAAPEAGPAVGEAPRLAAEAISPQAVARRLDVPAPWQLIHPLQPGSDVAHGWNVAGLTDVVDGSCVLTLQNANGRTHRVHLCRNDGRPQGLVFTEQLDLLVMNGGEGDAPTNEALAQSVAAVAHVIAANEGDVRQAPVLAALLPHAERLERFASAAKLR